MGGELSGRNCVFQESAPVTPVCANDYQLAGDTCIKTVSTPKDYTCEAGYSRRGMECVRSETAPASPVCTTPGHTLSGSTCQMTNVVAPDHVCPA
eukprot:Filipodium_phascolosomae@DN2811_c16_g2_i5.p1